jgi:DNA-binding transcriptional regulator YiaG
MNAAEFLGSLALLGMSQTDAARFFKVNGRTVRRWIEKEPPESVAIALWLMIRHGETVDSVTRKREGKEA